MSLCTTFGQVFVLERVTDPSLRLDRQPLVFEERQVPGLLSEEGPVSLHHNSEGFHVSLQTGPHRGKRIGPAFEDFKSAWGLFELASRSLAPEGALGEDGLPTGTTLLVLTRAREEIGV